MANDWKVKFTDDDEDGVLIASFSSSKDADNWIKCQEIQDRYDPCHFEVVEGPYREEVLSEDEDKKAEMSFKAFAKFVENINMEDVLLATIDASLVFISKAFDVDTLKFKDENPKLCKKLSEVVSFSKDPSERAAPMLAVHYPSTDVNLLLVANVPTLKDKSFKSMMKFGWKVFKKTIGYSALGMLIKDSSTFMLIPFKQDGDKIVHDGSENAYLLIAMTLLLSDIEFDTLWPTKAVGTSFMKYLDFICPSLMDVIGLATFGGASVAARAAKISAKVGAKKVAKAGAKKGLKKLSLKQLKLIAKIAKKAPKGTLNAIKKGHKAIKKAKSLSTLSRKMKDDLKGRSKEQLEQQEELAESTEEFDPIAYVEEFKDYFGYVDGYEPNKDYSEAYDALAREIALLMPTDTEAREIEGDAVILLVNSGDEEAVEAGKALGNCMMHKTKYDEQTLLKKMRDAFLALGKMQSKTLKIDESASSVKIWVDDVRTPPKGYVWIKSVNSFIDYAVEHGLDDVIVIDLDHDAGDYASDGGDYIKILDWLESKGAEGLSIRVHSSNPVGIEQMRQIMKKNNWKEVFDIYDDGGNSQPLADGSGLLDEAGLNDKKVKDPKAKGAEDTAAKRKIVDKIKDTAQDFAKKAANNDPEQFAKIKVAFDDLASAVGDYDFKEKRVLQELDTSDNADSIDDVENINEQEVEDGTR